MLKTVIPELGGIGYDLVILQDFISFYLSMDSSSNLHKYWLHVDCGIGSYLFLPIYLSP